ncbi:MAG: peptidoglycan-binding domain-containing protein [Myxococcota bacterium]|nr:peptidoglycan-binding domain-containing protein [Myxococcota bacterium]
MRILKPGSRGGQVSTLQRALNSVGCYEAIPNGIFGVTTEAAVVAFQKECAINADGIVGPVTWRALNKEVASTQDPRSNAAYRYQGPTASNRDRIAVIDDETALWAGRMCVGEGGLRCGEKKAVAMLWALMNRYFLHPSRKRWPTYLFLMRNFSQPINPRWQKGGDLAKKYANSPHCTPAKLKRRTHISSLTWGQIPLTVANAVRAFQRGVSPPAEEIIALERPRISNWASHKGLSEKYPWGICFDKSQQPDWFFEDKRLISGSVVVDYWQSF